MSHAIVTFPKPKRPTYFPSEGDDDMKRWFAILATCVLAFALILAGCGGKDQGSAGSGSSGTSSGGQSGTSGESGSGSAGQKVQIRLVTWAGTDEANELQAILDELNAKSDVYEIVQDS